MAHLVPHNVNTRGNGGGFSNSVPVVIPSKFKENEIEPEGEPMENSKKANRIVGDARVVNRAFSRLRISQV